MVETNSDGSSHATVPVSYKNYTQSPGAPYEIRVADPWNKNMGTRDKNFMLSGDFTFIIISDPRKR